MSTASPRVVELRDVDAQAIEACVAGSNSPTVFRGAAADWPLVKHSAISDAAAVSYLCGFYNEQPVSAFLGEPAIEGRIFYADGLSQTNFTRTQTQLDELLARILAAQAQIPSPTYYMGSTPLDYCLPGLRSDNSLKLQAHEPTVRIWIGNRTRVAPHYDALDNLACVCTGRRLFTLFPPEQLENLYVGPLDFTPAGQSISLVDINNPDFARFPRYAEALEHAQIVELHPGDIIYIPTMWWHGVEGLDSLNILINHWWRGSPAFLGAPNDALLHAILAIRDLPGRQRDAWKALFEHYVFSQDDSSAAHIPEEGRGCLAPLDEQSARQLRASLREKLNR